MAVTGTKSGYSIVQGVSINNKYKYAVVEAYNTGKDTKISVMSFHSTKCGARIGLSKNVNVYKAGTLGKRIKALFGRLIDLSEPEEVFVMYITSIKDLSETDSYIAFYHDLYGVGEPISSQAQPCSV